ncbi:hypothetical protein FGO68_gene8676 [Halteria grandinella]|uniref:Uncharacterized protein n=1 Tax=Halteria grandinella TaxID=5974 RepID=A0A8J8NJ47_HALGN|nr:hypothetical protein FGO68_gene8676 [Halteria grandinella]
MELTHYSDSGRPETYIGLGKPNRISPIQCKFCSKPISKDSPYQSEAPSEFGAGSIPQTPRFGAGAVELDMEEKKEVTEQLSAMIDGSTVADTLAPHRFIPDLGKLNKLSQVQHEFQVGTEEQLLERIKHEETKEPIKKVLQGEPFALLTDNINRKTSFEAQY